VQRPGNPSALTVAALAVALLWAIEGIDVNQPQIERVAILVSSVVLGWATLRNSPMAAGLTSYLAVLVAISERFRRDVLVNGSDVVRGTQEALLMVGSGTNPYSHCLQTTIPPCSPFVYPPGELAWYALPQWIFGDISRVDSWAGVLLVAAIALAGWRIGFEQVALPSMLYAAWGIGGYRAIDGSNDVSASLLVTLACVALVFVRGEGRASRIAFAASALLFGWAVAFKQFAVLILPPVVRYLYLSGLNWRRYALIALATTATFVAPFFLLDPGAFVRTQIQALTFHEDIWGANLLHTLQEYGDPTPLLPLFALVEILGTLVLVTLVSIRWRPPTIGAAVLAGAGVLMVALLFAKWTTQPYYAYVGGIIACGLALLSCSFTRQRGAGQDRAASSRSASSGRASP
jgi:hypothetical protein